MHARPTRITMVPLGRPDLLFSAQTKWMPEVDTQHRLNCCACRPRLACNSDPFRNRAISSWQR
jgi:hypothetical protein